MYVSFARGVADRNCPSALVLKARTGLPFLSFTSTRILGRMLFLASLTMPTMTLGVSGTWEKPALLVIFWAMLRTCVASCCGAGEGPPSPRATAGEAGDSVGFCVDN